LPENITSPSPGASPHSPFSTRTADFSTPSTKKSSNTPARPQLPRSSTVGRRDNDLIHRCARKGFHPIIVKPVKPVKLPPILSSSSGNRIPSALALLALAASTSILGCSPNPPSPKTATETATSSAAAPKRIPVTAPPAVNKHLYSAEADPKADIVAALKQAHHEHKRVILAFGGDWCGDCQVLDIYLHQSPNLELFDKNFLLVHVDIGRFDKNLDITEKYNVPLKKGVPALAVLDADGKLLYSQQAAEFGDMRYMYPNSVTDFLNRWKA
jgi:thiol-disulfide isomerase/thioredoxin